MAQDPKRLSTTGVEVRVKLAVSSGQAVELAPCFVRRVASWWRVCKTREIWLRKVWNRRGEWSWFVKFSMDDVLKNRLERSMPSPFVNQSVQRLQNFFKTLRVCKSIAHGK